jgi:hypothetical protein
MLRRLLRKYTTAIVLILSGLALMGCGSSKKQSMIYYTDQNNNSYTLTSTTMQYKAVQPSQSSSGRYSGGTSGSFPMPSQSYGELDVLARELLRDSTRHAQKREMMTSVLRMGPSEEGMRAILKPSAKRAQFEALLENLRKGDPVE